MQYLLTEEEYNALHGEGASEMVELEKQNLVLRSQIDSIINAFGQAKIKSYSKAEELNEKYIAIELMVRTLPDALKPIVELKTRTH